MSQTYSASDRAAAARCMDCPSCGAKKGAKCHYVGFPDTLSEVPAHKRRVDKYFIDKGEFMSRGGSGAE